MVLSRCHGRARIYKSFVLKVGGIFFTDFRGGLAQVKKKLVWWVRGIFVGNDVKLDETLFISLIVSGVFLVIPAFDYYPTFPGTLVQACIMFHAVFASEMTKNLLKHLEVNHQIRECGRLVILQQIPFIFQVTILPTEKDFHPCLEKATFLNIGYIYRFMTCSELLRVTSLMTVVGVIFCARYQGLGNCGEQSGTRDIQTSPSTST